jgi:predicted nucleotidyltransferase component of viral defense system
MNTIARLDKWKHRNIMKNILIDIYNDFELWTSLVFKWWTASYFFYDLDRFSTDLDFDLILENNNLWENIFLEKINNILKKYWLVKRSFNKKNTIFSLLSYWNIDHNIKIEISKRWVSGNFWKQNWFWSTILIMTEESIFSNKLYTLLNRTSLANRDIYDIYFFFNKNINFDIKLLEEKTWEKYLDFFSNIIDFLKKIPENHSILEWLGEVLNNDKHKDFVKNNLIIKLIEILEFRIKFDEK